MVFIDKDFSFYQPDYWNKVIIPGTDRELYDQGWYFWDDDVRFSLINSGKEHFENAIKYLSDTAELAEAHIKAGFMYEELSKGIEAINYEDAAEYHYQMAKNLMPNADNRIRLIQRSSKNSNFSNAYKEFAVTANNSQLPFEDHLKFVEFKIKAGANKEAERKLDSLESFYPLNHQKIPKLKALNYYLLYLNQKDTSYIETTLSEYKSLSALEDPKQGANYHYTLAKIYLSLNKTDLTLKHLNKAIDLGFNYTWVLDKDYDFHLLRETDEWKGVRSRLPESKVIDKEREFEFNTYWVELENR